MVILAINIPVILETLVIGILGSSIVALAVELWKRRKKNYRLCLTLESSEVYEPRKKSDVSIKVDYKGKTIDNALAILHVCITNEGQNDIMFTTHFSEAITIRCKGYRFLSVSAEDDKIKPLCELAEDGTAALSWEILKRGESIKLCIAAQSNKSSKAVIDRVDCYNNLAFDFRSDCIDRIESSHEMTQQDRHRRHSYNSVIVKYVYMIFICFLYLYIDMSFSSRYDITYEGQSYENSTLLYTPLFKKYFLISDTATNKVLSWEDMLNVAAVVPTNPVNTANKLSAMLEILILVVLISSVGFITYSGIRYSKYKRSGKRVTGKMKSPTGKNNRQETA